VKVSRVEPFRALEQQVTDPSPLFAHPTRSGPDSAESPKNHCSWHILTPDVALLAEPSDRPQMNTPAVPDRRRGVLTVLVARVRAPGLRSVPCRAFLLRRLPLFEE